jgi:GAF domain-containing protein
MMEDTARDVDDVAGEMQRLLLGADGVETFLTSVARHAAGAVKHALSCGISVQSTRSSRMLGATSDDFAHAMDEIQYDVDDGPCLTCLRTGEVVRVDDIPEDPRWPAFSRRGREAGAGCSVSVPMIIDGRSVGALNLYSKEPHTLTHTDRTRAQQFADQAVGAVALARVLAEREAKAQHLEAALTSRSTIDQAIGIIIARTGCGPERAFDLLRAQSQHTNEKLRDVADRIVAQASRPAKRTAPS